MAFVTPTLLIYGFYRPINSMDLEIPKGFCQCGCGEQTVLASRTRRSKGWVKGQPIPFIKGHSNRLSVVDGQKKCGCCRRIRPLNQFTKDKRTASGYRNWCRDCRATEIDRYPSSEEAKARARAQQALQIKIRREYVWTILTSTPCQDCGESDPIVLEFDHVRGEKLKNISHMIISSNLELLKLEIEKCDVVCKNCHTRREAQRSNHWKWGWSLSRS